MGNSALYNLYTEDYSADSIRKAPVTVQELIREGLSAEIASTYVELSEKLYKSFLHDVLQGNNESSGTLTVWHKLLELCVAHNISECDSSEEFPFYSFDVVLQHRGYSFPCELPHFRMTLEQALSYESLDERRLEREYNIIFTVDPDDTEYLCVVRMNPATRQLDKLPASELNSILMRIRTRRQKNEARINPNTVAKQISAAYGDTAKIKAILEENYHLSDEQLALDSLEEQLQEILNQPPIHNLSRKDLLWVFMGMDTCSENKHHLMDIRANFEFYNGTAKKCMIRRCANCKQYQMSFEQLEHIWKESKSFPKVEIIYVGSNGDIDSNYWNDRSVFSDHGYSVSQEKGLTAAQRQQKLKWIIDHGIMSKYDTIRFLRSRISINGMKPENWLARSKWEEDLRYVQSL